MNFDCYPARVNRLLMIEAAHSVHPGGKPIYAHDTFVLGVATAAIGLLHGKVSQRSWKRREIRLDENGVRERTSRFRGFTAAWTDVRDIRVTATSVSIDTTTGSHTISLGRYGNASEIRAAFQQWAAVRALPHAP